MSTNSTEHRALKVAGVTGLSSILAIGMQLVTVPICLKYWGKEPYGLWLALFSVFTMLQTTGTGFVNYVGNQINLLYHKDPDALQQTLASSLAGVAVLAALQLALVAGIIGFGALPDLLGASLDSAHHQNPELSLIVLAGSWILGAFYFGIIHRLQIPAGMMYQAAWWALGTQMSLFLVVICSAFFRFTLFQTSVLFALVQFCLVFASALYIRFKLPAFYPWWRGFDLKHGLRDLVRSIPLAGSGMLQQGTNNGVVILVSTMAGAAAVPAFTTVRTLANLWTNVTNILTTPLLPDVVRFHAAGEGRKLLAVHQTHGVVITSIVNVSILLAYPAIEPLYKLWTNQAVVLDKVLLSALLAGVSLMNLGAMMNTFLAGINHSQSVLTTTSARSAISLGLGGILLIHMGIAGLGTAMWAAELVVLLVLAYFFTKATRSHRGTADTPRRTLGPSLMSVVPVQIFLWVAAMDTRIAGFLYPVSIITVAFAAVWGWRRLDTDIRNRLTQLVNKRFRMKEAV